ncbi:MAG: hypothetical protein E7071_00140 [Bacteroidales bacterium]|nr:hypothetical protein [Bacteroidales bacterium]
MSNSRSGLETNRLIEKIDKVINLYETSLETIKKQKEELQNLTEELQELKSENRELQDRLKSSKLASAIKSGDSNGEAEAKINRLLREIDSCIALLNR